MGSQPENLSSQIDGATSVFNTQFTRTIGTVVVFHNGEKVEEDLVSEPNAKQVLLGVVPQIGDEVFVLYSTDETLGGRVRGYSQDPTLFPPPAVPQSVLDILEGFEARIDQVESDLEQPQDPKESVQAATSADLSATYDNVGGTGGNGSFTGAPLVVDGVTLLTGFRVLVKNQSNLDENGVYSVVTPGTGADGIWERASDFVTGLTQVTEGARLYAARGSQAGRAFILTTVDPIVIGGPAGSDLTWIVSGGSGSGGGVLVHETPTPTASQTAFTLAQAPAVPADVELYINNARYTYGRDFTVAGLTLTWGNPSLAFDLEINDLIEIVYSV